MRSTPRKVCELHCKEDIGCLVLALLPPEIGCDVVNSVWYLLAKLWGLFVVCFAYRRYRAAAWGWELASISATPLTSSVCFVCSSARCTLLHCEKGVFAQKTSVLIIEFIPESPVCPFSGVTAGSCTEVCCLGPVASFPIASCWFSPTGGPFLTSLSQGLQDGGKTCDLPQFIMFFYNPQILILKHWSPSAVAPWLGLG